MPHEIFSKLQLIFNHQIQNLIRELENNQNVFDPKLFKRTKNFLSNLFKKTFTNNLFSVAQSLNYFLKKKSSNRETLIYLRRLELLSLFYSKSDENQSAITNEAVTEKKNILLSSFKLEKNNFKYFFFINRYFASF